jgi:hypothetical protein
MASRPRANMSDHAAWHDWLIGGAAGIMLFFITLVLACYV